METTLTRLAEQVKQEVVRKLPNDDDVRDYRDGLSLYAFRTSSKKRRHVILAWQPTDKVSKVLSNKQTRLVHVAPKSGVSVSPELEALVTYSPWHPAALPYKPGKLIAQLTFEPVNSVEARKVLRRNVETRPKWVPVLRRAGIRLPSLGARMALKRMMADGEGSNTENEPQGFSARDAWRLEFGFGRVRATPIWRSVIRGVVRRGIFGMIGTKYNPFTNYLKGTLRQKVKPESILPEDLQFEKFAKAINQNL